MRRPLLLGLALAAAVAAVALVAGVGRPSAARGDTGSTDAVTTTGHGTVQAVPDRATVTAGVHTQAATAAQALAENATAASSVVAALKAAGGADLQTQQVSLYPQVGDNGDVRGYVADDSISATGGVGDAGSLIDAAVAAGANTVSGPTLDVSQRDALYRRALAKALGDARAKAQALAEAGGFSLGAVSAVTESSTAPQPITFGASAAKDAATPVEPGTQDVSADVTVTFTIG